jgi:hypothetical protein
MREVWANIFLPSPGGWSNPFRELKTDGVQDILSDILSRYNLPMSLMVLNYTKIPIIDIIRSRSNGMKLLVGPRYHPASCHAF